MDEFEQRLLAQEFITQQSLTENLARDAMIRALIATHPRPHEVKAAFQVLMSSADSQLPDNGFAAGLPLKMAQQMRKSLESSTEKWLKFFPLPRA